MDLKKPFEENQVFNVVYMVFLIYLKPNHEQIHQSTPLQYIFNSQHIFHQSTPLLYVFPA